MATAAPAATGKVIQITGPVVDIEFPNGVPAIYNAVNIEGGKIKVANLTKRVSDLLAIAKVLTVFDVYESDTEAVQSF